MPKVSKKKRKASETEQKQWVLIAQENELTEVKEDEQEPNFVKLRHPKTDQGAMFMFTANDCKVFEVLRFEDNYRSWFIQETVQQDGSIYMTTPMDPLFLILPYLIKADQSGMFMTLDQIVIDEDYPQCTKILGCRGISDLHHIADCKGSGEMKAYRYNKQTTLEWLKGKVERTSLVLKEKNIHAGSGAKVETFVRSRKDETSKDDYLQYAHGLVSDYLCTELSEELYSFLGIKDNFEESKTKTEGPPAKKAKLTNGSEPDEDYTKFNSKETNKQTEKSTGKQTAAQKALKKVDKTGMKSISSFFAPKSKTKK
ncbi:ribonuclease H2 subunit B-like isoform X2 [Glandiceps talaboti]